MSDAPWYEAAFERGYLDVYPHRDLASARREVAGLVRGGLAGRVLDLGCGFGRHTRALRDAGLRAFGLDLSADLLRHSASVPGSETVLGRLVRGDFRHLPFAAGSLDGVTMLFSSFGYFDDAGNRRVLAEIARTLAAGGRLVLDLMNAERIRRTLVPESSTERGGLTIHERRGLSSDGSRVRKEVTVEEPGGERRRWSEDVRLFDEPELATLLRDGGFALERSEGDFDGRACGPDAPRRIVWARRAEPS